MLAPKKVKYRKRQKGRLRGTSRRGATISFGSYALQAMESSFITARQIESARVAIVRAVKRGGKLWIRLFPDKPLTKKPAEVRMGKGKGAPEVWVARIRRGRVLFELDGVTEAEALEAMTRASYKLPIKTRFLSREARKFDR